MARKNYKFISFGSFDRVLENKLIFADFILFIVIHVIQNLTKKQNYKETSSSQKKAYLKIKALFET